VNNTGTKKGNIMK